MDSPDRAKILIVDDEASKLLALRSVLEELDQELVTASSGRDALRILLNEDFAVILLDVHMPDIDGFETAALIRQRKRSEHVPIIFVTSYYDDARALQSYTLGAVDYLMTPFVPEILRAKIRVFVDLFRMQQQVRLQAEQQIVLAQEQSARQAAEKANKSKSEFLANVSHELRTPMNAIIGMTQLALEEKISTEAKDYLLTAQSSAYVLLGLLNEILDLSRMEAGKFVLETVPFDVRELAEETVKALSVRAYEKGIECSLLIDPDVPARVLGDPLRLRQILMNLLGNAIKFTHDGEVSVHIGATCDDAGQVTIHFQVTDTGIGIAEEEQERIFAPFTQADSSMTRRYGGTGLGLSIAADLVRMMQGRIWLESELGAGATFHFTILAQQETPAAAPATAAPVSSQPPRVVVFDAAPQQARVTAALLQRIHCAPTTVGTTLELHAALAQTGHRPQLAMLTFGKDPLEMLPLVRRLTQEHPRLKLLLLVSAGDRQRTSSWLNAQPVHHVEKPVLLDDLRVAIDKLLEQSTSAPLPRGPSPSIAAPPQTTLRILVAEDTPANQKLLAAVLVKRGHQVQIARDGSEAVDLCANQRFDVILMDVQMPVVDGLQATREIRSLQQSSGWSAPIIAMTAHAMDGDRERFLSAGMDDYFAKPIHLPKLIEYLESLAPAVLEGLGSRG